MNLYVIDTNGRINQGTKPSNIGTIWFPDAKPAVAGILDDEFADNSFNNVLWSTFNPLGNLSVSEAEAGLIFDQPSYWAGNAISGVYQPIPSGDFTVWTKVSMLTRKEYYGIGGLALYNDAANPSDGIYTFALQQRGSDTAILVEYFHYYNAWSHGLGYVVDVVIGNTIYMRIRRNSNTYHFDWSSDGIGWTQLLATGLGTTPSHIGPYINNANNGTDNRAAFEFFRSMDSDVGLGGIMSGGRVTLYE